MKIVICGAGGMLATDAAAVFTQQGYELTCLTRRDLDIGQIADVMRTMSELKPDVIFNAAAFTNVDGCEANPDGAYQVNAIGPRNLAIAANEIDASLVQISTDYVFGGTGSKPYREYDPVNPQSVYGKSKLDGEILVRNHCAKHYIVRTAWLFGVHGNNFVRTMLRLAREKGELAVVNDQVGSPTYTWDLAMAIATLIKKPTYGTYHLTNSGTCSWYEFAQEILRQAGLTGVPVKPITTQELNRAAARPKYSVLDNYMWKIEGYPPIRDYRDALSHYLKAK